MFQLVRVDQGNSPLGEAVILDKLPFTLGRDQGADLTLEHPGVWESHGSFTLDSECRPQFICREEAGFWLNDQALNNGSTLKAGDLLKIGSVTLRFDLLPVDQKNSMLREMFLMCVTGLFVASQFYFIYQYLAE